MANCPNAEGGHSCPPRGPGGQERPPSGRFGWRCWFRRRSGQTTWRVTDLHSGTRDGVSSVSAKVGGREVWYASSDVELCPAAEAFVAPFVLPLLASGGRLIVDADVDAVWLDNVRKLPMIFRHWWGVADGFPIDVRGVLAGRTASASRTAQCFTAGVDSFYSALHGRHGADMLLYVAGFDVRLDEPRRLAAAQRTIETVARRLGKKALFVTTNLRQHPLLRGLDWGRTHGGALAGVLQTLRGAVARLIVPPSWNYAHPAPWGTHWETDPLWSSSAAVMEHDDASVPRRDKIAALAHEPLVQEHLRVCSKPAGVAGNCGRCEKCLRTMLNLHLAGVLPRFSAFPRRDDLPAALDHLVRVRKVLLPIWQDFANRVQDVKLRAAIERLVQRSRLRRFWAQLARWQSLIAS